MGSLIRIFGSGFRISGGLGELSHNFVIDKFHVSLASFLVFFFISLLKFVPIHYIDYGAFKKLTCSIVLPETNMLHCPSLRFIINTAKVLHPMLWFVDYFRESL